MSTALVIAIPVLLILAAVMVLATGRRRASSDASGRVTGTLSAETRQRDAEAGKTAVTAGAATRNADEAASEAAVPATRAPSGVAERQPVDEEEIQVSRRQFLNRGIVVTMTVSLGALAAACISFLYAKSAGGFGGKIDAGVGLDEVLAYNEEKKEPYYVPEARSYLVPYPTSAVPKARKVPQYTLLIPAMEQGIVAHYQKCPHLGCKVPWCPSSQWFECPCHGSKYNRVGEKTGGPAPRGLDHFVVEISGQKLTIDTGLPTEGAPIGTDTTGQGAEGPPCVG
ncbi:MAG: Rieske 2Fe-2S domain-containing protein [Actinobacteria bacterium]|nr:Rieske 2Fe-2S domain-containing protein [Actinomycetota bacterium]